MSNLIKIQNLKLKILLFVIVFCTLSQTAHAGIIIRPILNNGLTGYWDFQEGAGSTAYDKTGKENNGTITGATWANGQVGQALNFNGSSGYVQATGYDLPSFTASAWVKTSAVSNWKGIIEFTSSANDRRGIGLSTAGAVYIIYGSTSRYKISTKEVDDGNWHHVVGTFDGTTATVYVDGTSYSLGSQTSGSAGLANILKIGNMSFNGSAYYFSGLIDEVRVYNRALSPDEALRLYKSGLSTINFSKSIVIGASQNNQITNGLIGYWSFNGADMDGTMAYDRSGQGNNGTISSATTVIGKTGQGIFCNSASSIVLATTINLADNSDWAVSGWAKINDKNANSNPLLTMRVGRTTVAHCSVRDSKISYEHNNTTMQYEYGTSTVADGNWHFLTWVNNSDSTIDLYVDGVLENDGASSAVSTDGPYSMRICYVPSTITVDEVRVYNRALSSAEITRLYRLGK